ncbi:26S proteasome non-ATPase regulatory subunit 2-like [Tropilaelaps mercedesae]|uniref:26S proteasome non-ATPase regulatory subunit 2 n=1 Tax=Tropilaelaps mercedesae TaxID=418985 RepID=A0A1V9XD05_9ACAR|nr:26S proteasome non-ATPase regulatory subunit 2-like [Tropilaelaps mercedesae]
MVEHKSTPVSAENEKKNDPKKVIEAKEPELSEEDKQLQDELNMLVMRLKETDQSLYRSALESLRTLIRASTTSMTSVPKPLKFLRPNYQTLKDCHAKMSDKATKAFCADIISVLGMTVSEERDCLHFRLIGSSDEIGSWGHEYVRHLSAEIAQEWMLNEKARPELLGLTRQIVPYHMAHNAEAEACDLLMEVEQLGLLEEFVDVEAYPRVCRYLISCVPYVPDPDNLALMRTSLSIFMKFTNYPDALRLAMQLNDIDRVTEIFMKCEDTAIQKQMAFMMGRQQMVLPESDSLKNFATLNEIASNSSMSDHFLGLARELDIVEPKAPEDIYKSHLDNARSNFGGVDSARQNLASTFVNGFVNAAFLNDKLIMTDSNSWIHKNKEHGMMSATASLGLIQLWSVDNGLSHIDKYLYSNDDYIKAGAILACGIVNCGVRNDCDPAMALLSDYVLHESVLMRVGSILGLGLAYAGSNNPNVITHILPVFSDPHTTPEVLGIAALALGLIGVASQNADITSTVMTALLEKTPENLKDAFARFLPLCLGLLYLGKQESCEAIVAALEVAPEPFRSMATTMVECCAYAGTGNVLKIQKLLHICSEHFDTDEDHGKDAASGNSDKKDKDGAQAGPSTSGAASSAASSSDPKVNRSSQQSVAVLGLAMIAMGEDIGAEMAFRAFGHLLRYGEPCIKRAVPLALGLLSVSNPKLNILETLSKFSHDADSEVAHAAIFSMGIVGAGTNNARLAAMLRQLAQYHAKDANNLFMVRIAQGLAHLGKGTLTLSPLHSDRQLLRPSAVAGLFATLVALLDVRNTLLGRAHYLLFCLVPAMQPRMLITFDEMLQPLPVPVRVGQAVDVVGQAGRPKTITGFQTHTTPVLLSFGERAELATDEYFALTPVLEGCVILRKNPNHQP